MVGGWSGRIAWIGDWLIRRIWYTLHVLTRLIRSTNTMKHHPEVR